MAVSYYLRLNQFIKCRLFLEVDQVVRNGFNYENMTVDSQKCHRPKMIIIGF